MVIKYTKHALQRIAARNIKRDEIILAVNQPDDIVYDETGTVIAQKRIGDLLLRVFYYEEEGSKIIITGYKTSKIEKYLPKE